MNKKLRKVSIYILIIFFIIIGITPWIDGVIFKRNFFHLIELINQESHLQINVAEYHKGWFTSHAKLLISLDTTQLTQTSLTDPTHFTTYVTITHGPIIYHSYEKKVELGYANVQTFIHISEELEALLLGRRSNLEDTGIMQVNTLATFNNNWYGTVQMPVLVLSNKWIELFGKLTVDGLRGEFRIRTRDNQIRRVRTTFEIGAITLDSPTSMVVSKVSIQPLTYTYRVGHERTGLWSGNSSLFTPNISIVRRDGSTIILDKLAINNAFGMGSGILYNTNLSINLDNLTTAMPMLPTLSKLHIIFSANNFSSQGFYDYLAFLQKKSTVLAESINVDTLINLLVHTIIPISSFYSDVTADSSLGSLAIHSKTIWQTNAPKPNALNDVMKNSYTEIYCSVAGNIVSKIIEFYFDTIKTSGLFNKETPTKPQSSLAATSTETPLMDSPAKLIDDLVRIGYFSKNGNNYEMTLTIQEGVWKINNSVLNLPQSPSPAAAVTPTH